ncbi:MAG: hypothetical protein WDO24_01745 [Pseudomonadota bacterium]
MRSPPRRRSAGRSPCCRRPAAASAVGPAWFATLIRTVRAEFPEVEVEAILDCDRAAGPRHGGAAGRLQRHRVHRLGHGPLQAGRHRRGPALHALRHAPTALDLLAERDPAAACRAWLTG